MLGAVVIFQRDTAPLSGPAAQSRRLPVAAEAGGDGADRHSVTEMAHVRHGAIIVLERGTGLEDYIDTGTRLTRAERQAIEGIFYPNSALRDKAVIVRDQRLSPLNCPLPPVMPPTLGMRHRAAGHWRADGRRCHRVSGKLAPYPIASDGA